MSCLCAESKLYTTDLGTEERWGERYREVEREADETTAGREEEII